MLKLIFSNGTEIEVKDGSTIFDIMVEPNQYVSMWENLTNSNLKLVKLVSENSDLLDQRNDLAVDNEQSVREKDEIICRFYLREKNREELLEEKVAMLEEALGVHDGAIGDLAEAVSGLAEEGGIV